MWHFAPNRKGKQGLKGGVAPFTVTSNDPWGKSVIPILTTLGSEGLRGRRFPKKHTFSRGLSKGTIKF